MTTLICVRQLPYSEKTVQIGGLVAALSGSRVSLLTVIQQEDSRSAAETELERARALLGAHDADIIVRRGKTVDQILEESQSRRYETIVVGARGAESLLAALAEKIPARVANKARSSVLVVRGERTSLSNILIPIGGQRMRKRVLKAGAGLAKAAGAKATVLYVVEPIPSMFTGLEAMDESLEELLQTGTPIAKHLRWSASYLAKRQVDADIKIRHGLATDEITREARAGDYDLVVLGEPVARGPLGSLFIHPVTPHIVDHAACSVLVVR